MTKEKWVGEACGEAEMDKREVLASEIPRRKRQKK